MKYRPQRIEPDRAIPGNPSDDWIRHAEALEDNAVFEWRRAADQPGATNRSRDKK